MLVVQPRQGSLTPALCAVRLPAGGWPEYGLQLAWADGGSDGGDGGATAARVCALPGAPPPVAVSLLVCSTTLFWKPRARVGAWAGG
jgi:hypothetical protein